MCELIFLLSRLGLFVPLEPHHVFNRTTMMSTENAAVSTEGYVEKFRSGKFFLLECKNHMLTILRTRSHLFSSLHLLLRVGRRDEVVNKRERTIVSTRRL